MHEGGGYRENVSAPYFIVVILIAAALLGTQKSGPAECSDPPCLSANFFSCAPSEMKMPFGESTYTIAVIGMENGKCHWKTSFMSETRDCHYPTGDMSQDAFGHLFGQDKTGTECLSEKCRQQEQMMSENCITSQGT